MKKKIKEYFKHIGIIKGVQPQIAEETYLPATCIKVADRYLNYLKEIDTYQKNRRTTIENKNAQLVGQASIVTSIFSLFIPLLFGSFNDLSKPLQIVLSVIFVLVLGHYLLTIIHAIRTLKIDKYKYPTRKTSTITKQDRGNSELDFINEEIDDLVYTINHVHPIDNRKGENLIFGSRCFEIANIGFGVLTLLILASAFIIEPKDKEVKVKNLSEIELRVLDTINDKLINQHNIDSITIKIDTSNNLLNVKPIRHTHTINSLGNVYNQGTVIKSK